MRTRFTVGLVALVVLAGALLSAQTLPPDLQQFWNLLRTGGYAFSTGRVLPNGYFNYGNTVGTNGYGFRDLAGIMQFKNSGGSWAAFLSGSGNPCPGDGTTVIKQVATNDLGIYTGAVACVGGTLRFDVSATAVTSAVPVRMISGAVMAASVTAIPTADIDIQRDPPFVTYAPYMFHVWQPVSGVDNRQTGVVIDGAGNIRLNTSITVSGNPFQSLPNFVLNKNSMISISSDLGASDPSLLILTTTSNGGPHIQAYNGTTNSGILVFQVANDGTTTAPTVNATVAYQAGGVVGITGTCDNPTFALGIATVCGGSGGILTGTTGSIGGGLLTAGTCASGTVAVTNSTTTMVVAVSPNTYPGDGTDYYGYVSTNGTVTVKVCAIVGLTPTASTYNVRVIP